MVLCSDGVSDSFGDRVALANFINNANGKSPQQIADEVIAECLNRSGRMAMDDCTVIVGELRASI